MLVVLLLLSFLTTVSILTFFLVYGDARKTASKDLNGELKAAMAACYTNNALVTPKRI
jgi:type II secretory pathway pseudopilin PulG